jgi:hypothetical protein
MMKRTWTKVGEEYTQDKHTEITGMIDRLKWQSIPCDMAAGPGLAIKEAIKKFRIPKVTSVACSNEMAPYGLESIEGNYKNGRVRIYLVDDGVSLTPICTDLFEVEKKTGVALG